MDLWVDDWMGGWMSGWVDDWMGGWMSGWMGLLVDWSMVGLRRSVAKQELALGGIRGRDIWRRLVLGGGKPWYSGRSLD
jgi:hypothetical protein